MSASAVVRQSDLRRMAAVAREYGVCVEMEVHGTIIRVRPDTRQLTEISEPGRGGSLAQWRSRHENLDIPFSQIPKEPIQPPLNHREARAMAQLVSVGIDRPIDWYALKNFGKDTQKKLSDRGFIGVGEVKDKLGNPDTVWLTSTGAKAMRDQHAHHQKYPIL